MSKTDPVTKAEVQQAREQLQRQGRKVTYAALRQELGERGSLSTIAKYLKEIEGELDGSSASPAVQEALGTLWELALSHARKESAASVEKLSKQQQETLAEVERLEGEIRLQRETIAARDAQLTEGSRLMGEQSQEMQRLTKLIDSETGRANALQVELGAANERQMTAVRDVEQRLLAEQKRADEYRVKLGEVELAGVRIQAKLEAEVSRLQADASQAALKVSAAESRVGDIVAELERARGTLESERASASTERAEYRREIQDLRQKLEAAQLSALREASVAAEREKALSSALLDQRLLAQQLKDLTKEQGA